MGQVVPILPKFLNNSILPFHSRLFRQYSGWILALVPISIFYHLTQYIGPIYRGESFRIVYPWVNSLGVQLSFYLDGLSLLFGLIISGIGTFIILYSGVYLKKHTYILRFYIYILFFMGSMLGLVLSDNLITLFIFWELTSFTSYILNGFEHEKVKSRNAALQSLLVLGVGGLALLSGMILLGNIGGSFEISELLSRSDIIRENPLYLPILLLILAGAFTKSAQVPFHFWLPSAMESPTPVSDYLYSATMVKSGIYLVARLNPIIGNTEYWNFILPLFGGLTMLIGIIIALYQTDLKQILAYSTISALGTLIFLIGLGNGIAIKSAMVFLLAHASYIGTLFLVAGALEHATGTRDIRLLGGLYKYMPITAFAGILAACSMMGLPPFFGFIRKDLFYETVLQYPFQPLLLTAIALLTNILFVVIAIKTGIKPFFGNNKINLPNKPQEGPAGLWIGPLILSSTGLLIGLFSMPLVGGLIQSSTTAVLFEPIKIKLTLWSGFTPVFFLSVLTILAGILFFIFLKKFEEITAFLKPISRFGPSSGFVYSISGLFVLANKQTRFFQNGYLRYYLLTIIGTIILLTGYTFYARHILYLPGGWLEIRYYEWGLLSLFLLSIYTAIRSKSRLGMIISVGLVGYSVALIFILFGAPDIALTKFIIATLTIVLLVLVLYHLPYSTYLSSKLARIRDIILSLIFGGIMTLLVLMAKQIQLYPAISEYFVNNSVELAQGRNIVNVILVNFRALDTLGAIIVLAIAALGIFILLSPRLIDSQSKTKGKNNI